MSVQLFMVIKIERHNYTEYADDTCTNYLGLHINPDGSLENGSGNYSPVFGNVPPANLAKKALDPVVDGPQGAESFLAAFAA